MRVFLRSSLIDPITWTLLIKGEEEGTRALRVAKPQKMSVPSTVRERAPTMAAPSQAVPKVPAPHLEKVSSPHHQAAAAQAIMRMSQHEYKRTRDLNHAVRAQRAQRQLNHFAAQGIVPNAQHHADWVDHYGDYSHKYAGSSVPAMSRSRWHKIAGGIEFSGYGHEQKPEWTDAQLRAATARKPEPSPASDLGFERPEKVSRPKVQETIGYTRKMYGFGKSLINALLLKAFNLRRSIYQSAKTPEEAAQNKQWAKEDFSAPSLGIEHEPKVDKPKQEKPEDIHLRAAHHIVMALHHNSMADNTHHVFSPGQTKIHQNQERFHRGEARKLIGRGAIPMHPQFEKLSDRYHRESSMAPGVYSRPENTSMGFRRKSSRLAEMAEGFARSPHVIHQQVVAFSPPHMRQEIDNRYRHSLYPVRR